jgi:phosphoribosylglycinamide formyltransferase 1
VSGRPAAFLDRDGTIIQDVGYITDPAAVRLLPGAGAGVRLLNQHGIAAVVVTNQSGIARGLLTLDEYFTIEHRVSHLLAREGAHLDAQYFCPHLPELTGPCACRKPGPLLYREAAERFTIDLGDSWWVGDRVRDVLPAEIFGGRGILVGRVQRAEPEALRFARAPDLRGAVEVIVRSMAPIPGDRLPSPPMPMRIAVAISGQGSNLEALHQALATNPSADIVLVISDRADAAGLGRARSWGISAEVLPDHSDGAAWLSLLRRHAADLLVLAGYLRLVPPAVVAAYPGRIINVHPALLPAFGGRGMYGRRVHQAVLDSGARESGATVHLVDEVYDHGAPLAQARVPVLPGDTPETLARRVLELEHRLLPAVVLAAAAAGRPVPLTDPVESSP